MGTTRTFIGNIKGVPGNTPYVGANKNWWIGDTDTGIKAEGENGKNAFQYAVDGGYTGTEAEFAAKLNETAKETYSKGETDTIAQQTLTSAKNYTDTEIAELINGAPTTLDTLGEIATAMADNADVVAALNSAIGSKANASDLTDHVNDKNNPHGVTAAQVGAAESVHNQAASTITAGTFGGQVAANSAGQTASASIIRNSKIVLTEETPAVEGEIVWVCK